MAVSSLALAACISWAAYGLALWWIGRREHVRPKRGPAARVGSPPGALRRLCGIPPQVDSVHVPMAVLQMTGVAVAALGIVSVFAAGWGSLGYRSVAGVLAPVPLIGYLVAEVVMAVRDIRRGR